MFPPKILNKCDINNLLPFHSTYIRRRRIKKRIKFELIILLLLLLRHLLERCLRGIEFDAGARDDVLTSGSEDVLLLLELLLLLVLQLPLLRHALLHLLTHLRLHGTHHFVGGR